MNIENLKNMPVVGQPPAVELGEQFQLIADISAMERLASSTKRFQEILEFDQRTETDNQIETRLSADTTAHEAAIQAWANLTSERNATFSTRIADLQAQKATFDSKLSAILGSEEDGAGVPASTVFGLIAALDVEDASWEKLLSDDTASLEKALEAIEQDVVADVSNPMNGLDFTGDNPAGQS